MGSFIHISCKMVFYICISNCSSMGNFVILLLKESTVFLMTSGSTLSIIPANSSLVVAKFVGFIFRTLSNIHILIQYAQIIQYTIQYTQIRNDWRQGSDIKIIGSPDAMAWFLQSDSTAHKIEQFLESSSVYVTASPRNQLFPGISSPFRESGESLKWISSKLGIVT